jgi:hypothetical protein
MTMNKVFHKTYSLFYRKRGMIKYQRISCNALTLNRARHHYQSMLLNLSMTPGIEPRLMPAAEIMDEQSMALINQERDKLFEGLKRCLSCGRQLTVCQCIRPFSGGQYLHHKE